MQFPATSAANLSHHLQGACRVLHASRETSGPRVLVKRTEVEEDSDALLQGLEVLQQPREEEGERVELAAAGIGVCLSKPRVGLAR
jgi:hypothetical protein